MPPVRIDFYVLPSRETTRWLVFACRLVEKAYRLKNGVFINTESQAQAQQLDEMLWTFRDGSFVPHEIVEPGAELSQASAPVLIGGNAEPASKMDLLVNLAPAVPTFLDRFERAAEVVDSDAARRTAARERFKFYREQGYALESHKLNHS